MSKGKAATTAYVRLMKGDQNKYKVRKGYVPVLVGKEGSEMEKLWIPTKLIGHPYIVALLNFSADEFGYAQHGLLQIAHEIVPFKKMVQILSGNNN